MNTYLQNCLWICSSSRKHGKFTRADWKQRKCLATLPACNTLHIFAMRQLYFWNPFNDRELNLPQSTAAQEVRFVTCIREVDSSDLTWGNIDSEAHHAFPQSDQANARTASQIKLLLKYSLFFLTHYIILPFNTTQPKMLTAFWNKPQVKKQMTLHEGVCIWSTRECSTAAVPRNKTIKQSTYKRCPAMSRSETEFCNLYSELLYGITVFLS
jgi:hypothetical protein